jgi:uncharacterized membrane protein (UPF0127 family)
VKAGRSIHPALLLVVLPPVLVAATCAGKKGSERAAPEPTVFLSTGGQSEVRVRVEVARTSEERRLGLMHRQTLDKGSGMIFLFDKQEIQTFWMKNTFIALDMIFIGSDLEVVGVVHDAEPMSLKPCMVDEPSQFVLEVEAGFASRHGIGPGTTVRFTGFDYPGKKE